jgi:DNA-binding transcriptional ArsR family regulator
MAEDNSPTIRMRGAGYYSEHTGGAKNVIDAAIPLALGALGRMDLAASSSPFGIADFGAADGGTSIALHHALIAAIRAHSDRAITVTYTDLPHNDFSALFRLLHGLLPGKEAVGLADLPGVFTFASGTSFHRQVFPNATLALGFSATAMHWLSRLPATLSEHVHAVGAVGGALAAFRAQAAADWEAILLARARELAPGGRLVLANFCTDAAGYYLGWTGGKNMHATFTRHWAALRDAGLITDDEVRRATFPQFYRTVEEFRAPFDEPASAVSRAGLRLEQCLTRVTPCPYAEKYHAGQPAKEFARAYVPTLRSWSESVFAGALDPARPRDERQHIVDRFYAAYEADVAAEPEGHGMDYVHCFMVIAKIAPPAD